MISKINIIAIESRADKSTIYELLYFDKEINKNILKRFNTLEDIKDYLKNCQQTFNATSEIDISSLEKLAELAKLKNIKLEFGEEGRVAFNDRISSYFRPLNKEERKQLSDITA